MQPTSLCNLNCDYCYLPDRLNRGIMSEEIVRKTAEWVFASGLVEEKVQFLWHAGEPLMAGLEHFRSAVEIITELLPQSLQVSFAVQTNATLVDDAWCEFFLRYNFHVGVSIDGPADLHDTHRRNWAGRGSHEAVMRGAKLLQRSGVRSGALCVLTRESLSRPDELYDFFADANFGSVGFNVEESEGAHLRSRLQPAEVSEAYRDFMRRMMKRCWEESGRLEIREIRDLASLMAIKRATDPRYTRRPDETHAMRIITISKAGDISTFSPELAATKSAEYADFIVGNVAHNTPEDVLAGAPLRRLQDAVKSGVEACQSSCAYFELCGGGFISNKYVEHGTLSATETTSCALHRKVLSDVLIDWLREASIDSKRLGS